MVVCSVRVFLLLQTTMDYITKLLDAFEKEFPPASLEEDNSLELPMSQVLQYFSPYLGDSYSAEAYTKLLSDRDYQMRFSDVSDEVVWLVKSVIKHPSRKT